MAHHDETTGGSAQLGWRMEGTTVEIADILMNFAQELRRGDVSIWKGQRELHLDPAGRIDMQVEAISDDDGKEGLHVKLHWKSQQPDRNALGSGATFYDQDNQRTA